MATVATSVNYSAYESTSSTSVTLDNSATSSVSFTIETGKAWVAGDEIACIPTAAKIPMMCIGTVTSYNSGTGALVVSINRFESNIPSWDLVSSSSNTIGTGSKTFLTYNGKSAQLAAADNIMVARQSTSGANRFVGTVTSYNNADGTLVMNCTATIGSGTSLTDWVIVSGGTFTAWAFCPAPTATYTVADNVTLTFNSQPIYPLPMLECLGTGTIDFQNSSTTTMRTFLFGRRNTILRFENNGNFKSTVSDWITLGTGTGAASQFVTLTGNGLDAVNALPFVMVETGSGTGVYKAWPVIASRSDTYGGTGNYQRRYGQDFSTLTSPYGVGKDDVGNVGLYTVTNRRITFGDGTNGNVIPSGAKIRVPNIYFDSELKRSCLLAAIALGAGVPTGNLLVGDTGNLSTGTGETYTVNGEEFLGTITSPNIVFTARAQNSSTQAAHAQGDTIYSVMSGTGTTAGSARSLTDFDAGAKVVLNKVIFGPNIFFTSTNHQVMTLTDCFFFNMIIQNTTAPTAVNGLYSTTCPYADNVNPISISSTQGALSIQNVSGCSSQFATNSTPAAVIMTGNQNVILAENITGTAWPNRNGSSTTNAVSITTNIFAEDVYVKNITCIGGRLNLQNSTNIEVDGYAHSDNYTGLDSSTAGTNMVIFQNVKGGVLRNVSKLTGGTASRGGPISTDASCKDIVVHTVSYQCNNNSGTNSLSGNNIRIVNADFGTVRDAGSTTNSDAAMSNNSTADTVNLQNVQFIPPTTYGIENGNGLCSRAFYEFSSGHSMFWRTFGTAYAGNFQEYGPFHVLLDSGTKATGTLLMAVGAKLDRDILDLTGTAYHGNNGSIYLPTINDTVVIKSYQALRSITGFAATAVDPEDNNSGNLTYEFELQNYEGTFTGTWTSLTAANLQTAFAALTGYDSDKGLAIRIRVTATATNATNAVLNIRMFTTNDVSFNPPIGYIDYTITGVDTDSTLAGFDGSTEVEYETGVSGSVTLHLPYEYDGLDKSHAIKIRCYDCTWDDHTWTHRQFAATRASLQAPDTEITEPTKATVAAYTSLGTCAKIYDYAKYWGTLRANLLLDLPVSKNGSALDFGSYDVVIDKTAVSVFDYDGSTVTIKADQVDTGSITTTGTITLSNGAVTGTASLSASNGVSGLIQILGLTDCAVYVKDNAGAQFDYQASVTGTYEKIVPFGSTGAWQVVTKVKGYRHAYFNFTASTGGNFISTPSMPQKLNADGSVMYQGTTTIYAAVSFAGTTQANIDIADGTAGLQAIFDETEDALVTNDGMIWLASGKSDCSQFNSAGGDYLFMSTGWRLRRAAVGDVNATVNAFVIGADGTIVDGVNGGVQFLTSDSPTAIASAVWAAATRTLTSMDALTLKQFLALK